MIVDTILSFRSSKSPASNVEHDSPVKSNRKNKKRILDDSSDEDVPSNKGVPSNKENNVDKEVAKEKQKVADSSPVINNGVPPKRKTGLFILGCHSFPRLTFL